MFRSNTKAGRVSRMLAIAATAFTTLCAVNVHAAIPGITGDVVPGTASTPGTAAFYLTAAANYISQPDGATIYTWGYGCDQGHTQNYYPAASSYKLGSVTCQDMQMPGPTMIVDEGTVVTIKLSNKLPVAAGNTSLVVPGFTVTPVVVSTSTLPIVAQITNGVSGLVTQEAIPGGSVTYQFTASKPGTYSYYSGTQPEIQVQMGMSGAIIVRPKNAATLCPARTFPNGEPNLSISTAAYNNASTCYDREYLFQLGEIDTNLNYAVLAAVEACPTAPCPPLNVSTEPYWPQYYLVNGRSLPDTADIPYAPGLTHQPYNGNPHIHPGDKMLIRLIGAGRYQHPLHIHANHARAIAYDGNLVTSATSDKLAGEMFFTLTSVSGQTMDSIFTWTGKDLNWDIYNHKAGDGSVCIPDANGFYTSNATAPNYGEWCADHLKKIPVTPPDPAIVANGLWYGGTPYLGLQSANPTPLPPGANIQNPDAAYGYPWHSHDEREITTNNVFPGGLMMIFLVDPPSAFLDETL